MEKQIKDFNSKNLKKISDVKPGDTVRVHTKIKEGSKERTQIFEGVVLKKQGGENPGASITVRKISYGIGVERTFLLHSPLVGKVQVVKRAKVRRANIEYLKNLTGKSTKLKEKQFDSLAVNVKEEDLAPVDKNELEEEVIVKEDTENLEEAAKEELKKMDKEDIDTTVPDEEKLEDEEVEAGIERAEKDLEKGKDRGGEMAEKEAEDKIEE